MKNIFKRIPKKLIALSAVLVTTAVLGSSAIANFGPDRPTRAWTPQATGFDYVTFNSFTGVPEIGDERDFLRGVVTGRDGTWVDPVVNVAEADTVTAKVYIHNNAKTSLNTAPGAPGIAKDVNVKIEIPTGLKADHEVNALISSSNAQPVSIYDSLDIDSVNDSLFQLSYVPGSAKMGGVTLSDAIFTTGINIGDQNGCFEYLREITFELDIQKPAYKIQKDARLKGETKDQWRDVVNAKEGDTIQWRISFLNAGTTDLNEVNIFDDLPSYTEVVPNTVRLVNSNNPNGFIFDAGAIQDNGDKVNIGIGDYAPGGAAYIYLETKIDESDDIECGIYQIANIAFATPKNLGAANDNAKVNIINEECDEEIVTMCTGLTGPTATLKTGELTTLTATAQGEGLQGFIFRVNGQVVQDSDRATYDFLRNDEGEYKVTAEAKFATGNKTSADCEKTITVTKKASASYSCDDFKFTFNDRTGTASFIPTAANGAKFKDATIVFTADGKKVYEETTNKLSSDGRIVSTNKFSNSDKNVYAKATVRFTVEAYGGAKVVSVECQGSAVLGVVTEKCTIPGKENLPKNSPDCKVTVIPNTGAGDIAMIMVAVTAAGAVAHRTFALKRQ